MAWLAFGPPQVALYFPLCLVGELPAGFSDGISASSLIQDRVDDLLQFGQGKDAARRTAALERLQAKFDQDVEDFLIKAHDYQTHGKPCLVGQLATEMMHEHVDLFDRECNALLGRPPVLSGPKSLPEDVLYFA